MLHIATFNIHKGFSQFNQRLVIHELRDELRRLNPDILFLQEVQGLHLGHAQRHATWPEGGQHEFLAESVWEAAYGQNMVYDHGHHGNAILTRFPIVHSHNQDVTRFRYEKRGLLHCRIAQPDGQHIHCVSVHLSLFGRSRRHQLEALADYLEGEIPGDVPLIIAGDFNDWRNRADRLLAQRLGLVEVFSGAGKPVRSFPAALPVLRLDRIYTRGFQVMNQACLSGRPWSRISDHAPLSAHLRHHGP